MLDLTRLASGNIPAITPALGSMLAEAAGVCLESQDHSVCNTVLYVSGTVSKSCSLRWIPITPQARRAYQNETRTTEHGAEGIAVLLADRELELTVIEASWIGTGFDYWLGEENDETFQRKGRLEVSGIRQGNDSDLNARVQQKLTQTSRSDCLGLPAYVIVVEFGQPTARVVEK